MVIVALFTLNSVFGGEVPSDTFDYALDCYFPNNHYLKLDDGVLRVNCFVNSDNLSCVSKVYSMVNFSFYDEILQTNPDVIHNSRVNAFFTPSNNQLNVYFNNKNLLLGSTYLYAVECSGVNGRDVYFSYVNVSNNKLMSNINPRILDFKDNSSYYVAFFFVGLGFIFIISLLWLWWKQ